jgi:hypothetical protein
LLEPTFRKKLLVTANGVPSWLILSTLVIEAVLFTTEASFLTRATRRHIAKDETFQERN